MIFLREVFPEVPQIQLAEFYYRSRGADVGFDREFDRPGIERDIRLHAGNAPLALSLCDADAIVTPTQFQADLFPPSFRSRMRVIHEGIDTAATKRRHGVTLEVDGISLDASRPVVTFVNRYFEPLRGFHIFMRALPRLLDANSDAHVLIIGSKEQKGYGTKVKDGSWYDRLMREVGSSLDPRRVHFLGTVDYDTLLKCFSISAAHVYFTYPFVLSWSLLDAMACECVLVGSDTAPVREVIRHKHNGLLTDFFDHRALADCLLDVLARPARYDHLRQAARETIRQHYDRRSVCDPAWLALVDELVPGETKQSPLFSSGSRFMAREMPDENYRSAAASNIAAESAIQA